MYINKHNEAFWIEKLNLSSMVFTAFLHLTLITLNLWKNILFVFVFQTVRSPVRSTIAVHTITYYICYECICGELSTISMLFHLSHDCIKTRCDRDNNMDYVEINSSAFSYVFSSSSSSSSLLYCVWKRQNEQHAPAHTLFVAHRLWTVKVRDNR